MHSESEVSGAMDKARHTMEDAIQHLVNELSKLRAGKANPSLVSGIFVDYYGNPTPLNQVANVSASDSRTLAIQPWEKSMIAPIERAIFEANLGLTPQNNGEQIMLVIPPLTEERRKDLVKKSKAECEDAKVSLRNGRHKVLDVIKKAVKDGYPEDMGKRKEDEIQKMLNEYVAKVDKLFEAKEKEILTV